MIPRPVSKTIGGVTFEDPYAHLQEDTPETLTWQWSQDEAARVAAQSSPGFEAVRARLLALGEADGGVAAPLIRGGKWFSIGAAEGAAALRVQDSLEGPVRVIDTAKAIAERAGGGVSVGLYWFDPSPIGTYVAVAYGVDGDMTGTWNVYEVGSGVLLASVPALAYTGARLGWLPDESGFWLNGRTVEGLHRLTFVPVAPATSARAPVVLGSELIEAKHAGLTAQISPDGRQAILVTEPHEHIALVWLDLDTGQARPFLPEGWNGECDGTWIDNATYVARVNGDAARGRVVAIPVATSQDPDTWRELVAQGDGFMAWAGVVAGRLYVGEFVDVSQRIRVFDLHGRLVEELPLQGPGSSPSMFLDRTVRPTEVFTFTHATFLRSSVLMIHDAVTGVLLQVGEAGNRLGDVVVDQRFAISRDGARIPYFLIRRADVDGDGPQPTLVTGYGGFNVSLLPRFPTTYAPFIEAGGVFVQTSLRGGSEYGRAWHDGGRLKNKQNTFDDLAAVAEALIEDGVSIAESMAFQGASNGGLLAGVAAVQQPHLWRAVAPVVPVFDMMEPLPEIASTAGLRAIFYEDYGDPTDPEDAVGIIQWSPYHNIRDGAPYPAVYQVFGERDLGCMPFHGRKFTARLRDADSSGRPIHLRVWRNTGHGMTDPVQSATSNAEWLSFIMDQIGLEAAGAPA